MKRVLKIGFLSKLTLFTNLLAFYPVFDKTNGKIRKEAKYRLYKCMINT